MGSRLNWLVSESGRRAVSYTMGVISASTLGVFLLPHSFFVTRYKDILQMYRHGLAVKLDRDVDDRAQAVLQNMELKESKAKSIHFYTINGTDVYQIGSTHMSKGAYIGLPSTFSYKCENDVDRNLLKVGDSSPDWDSKEGKSLKSALVLSETAQNYVIARDTAMADTYWPYVRGGFACTIVLATYWLAQTINIRSQLYSRPRPLRLTMYSLVCAFGWTLWAFCVDASTNYFENYADKRTCDMGAKWTAGGVEFYEKTLQKNKALRNLMGKAGEKRFTLGGNDVVFLRTPHLPFTQRLEYVRTRLKEYEEKDAVVSEQQN